MAVKTPVKPTAAKPAPAPKPTQQVIPPKHQPKEDVSGVRPVLYPVLTVCGVEIPEENLYKSAQEAKELLGWESESEHEARLTADVSAEVASKMNVKYQNEYDLMDYNKEKVKLRNNTRNRPTQEEWVKTIAQEILNNRWEFNGESCIFGKTGLALSFQHRGLGLIRAQQMIDYAGDDEDKLAVAQHWQKVWGKGHTLKVPFVDVRGIDEGANVTRTLDNVRPRSLSDVLFADTSMFAKTAKADRDKLCKLTDYAIRTVWARTGESDDPFSPRRTHSESLEFITRHPRLIKAVSFIFTEINRKSSEGEKVSVLSDYIAPGTAAGLMFLMGASASDRKRYDDADQPNDRHLDFSRWDDAETYFAGIGDATNKTFECVRKAIGKCGNAETGAKAPVPVKFAVLVNGWNELVTEVDADGNAVDLEDRLTVTRIMPEFGKADDYGVRPLVAHPSVGGIDLGDPAQLKKDRKEADAEEAARIAAEQAATEGEGETTDEPDEDTKAEQAARAAQLKREKLAAKVDAPAPAPKKGGGLKGGLGK